MLRSQKNQEVACLKKQVREIEGKVEEEVTSIKNGMKAEVKKELDIGQSSPNGNWEKGLKDPPFEMVGTFQKYWDLEGVLNYNPTTVESNNSDRPRGADGTMSIETGVFTASTSGYYIITLITIAIITSKGEIIMWLQCIGVTVEERLFQSRMEVLEQQ